MCEGGELYSQLVEDKFSEQKAAKIIKQTLSAIKHIHKRGICHRDLKLENIMLTSTACSSKDPFIKVIDFGLSKYFKQDDCHLMVSKTGTPYYMAPEVLQGKYDEMCDMWSIGVVAYSMLAGYPPFNVGIGESDALLYRRIECCDYEFLEEDWDEVSEEAKDFIGHLLEPNLKKRMKPEDAIKHPWI